MGLHLNYELRLPGSMPTDEVDASLAALHSHAQHLPFEEIGPIYQLETRHADDEPSGLLRLLAGLIAEPNEEDAAPFVGEPRTARGFAINPGKGCETALVGFLARGATDGSVREWFWHFSCKTQYASLVSEDHLVMCHTALTRLLDHAAAIGVNVIVRDETHYWETRDEQRLIDEVRTMNRVVARFAGRLSDVLGEAHSVEAPVFGFRDFERLEMGQ